MILEKPPSIDDRPTHRRNHVWKVGRDVTWGGCRSSSLPSSLTSPSPAVAPPTFHPFPNSLLFFPSPRKLSKEVWGSEKRPPVANVGVDQNTLGPRDLGSWMGRVPPVPWGGCDDRPISLLSLLTPNFNSDPNSWPWPVTLIFNPDQPWSWSAHMQTSHRPGGSETICPPPRPMAVRLAVDLRPSADGSAVRTSLVAGQLQAASVPIA